MCATRIGKPLLHRPPFDYLVFMCITEELVSSALPSSTTNLLLDGKVSAVTDIHIFGGHVRASFFADRELMYICIYI